jgi:hypothetical protein
MLLAMVVGHPSNCMSMVLVALMALIPMDVMAIYGVIDMDATHGTFWVGFDHNYMPRYSSITNHLGHGHMTKTYPFICIQLTKGPHV